MTWASLIGPCVERRFERCRRRARPPRAAPAPAPPRAAAAAAACGRRSAARRRRGRRARAGARTASLPPRASRWRSSPARHRGRRAAPRPTRRARDGRSRSRRRAPFPSRSRAPAPPPPAPPRGAGCRRSERRARRKSSRSGHRRPTLATQTSPRTLGLYSRRMAVSPGFRIGAIALLSGLVVLLGVVLFGGPSSDANAAAAYKPPRVDQTRMVLRRPDLPPGYGNGYLGEGRGSDGLLCEAFTRSSDRKTDPVAAFARMYRAKGCMATYVSRFSIPGQEPVAPVVGSGVVALGSAAAAAEAWDLAPTMLGRLLPGPPREVETSTRVGTQTRLFHAAQAWYPYLIRGKKKASILVWRSGNNVATVLAMGASFATNDRVVAELAPRQQAHVRKPTPYTGAERSDAEVGLDDPAIDIPVYWLGRNFRPGQGLPDNRLFGSYFSGKRPRKPSKARIRKRPNPPSASVTRTSGSRLGPQPGASSPNRRRATGSPPGTARKRRRSPGRSSHDLRRLQRELQTGTREHRKRSPPGSTSAVSRRQPPRPRISSKRSIPTAPSRAWKRSSAA